MLTENIGHRGVMDMQDVFLGEAFSYLSAVQMQMIQLVAEHLALLL